MRIGILGYGSIGQRHHMNIHKLGGTLSPIWHDPAQPSNSYDRECLIRDTDAIIVCSPSQQHGRDFCDSVDAGKHVLVEKPFGYDCPPYLDGYVQGTRTRQKKLIIATGYNVRFHQCVQKTKQILARGELGELQAASFSVLQKSEKPDYLRDGIIRNWLSHEIDLAHYFFGEGKVLSCTADDQREAFLIMKFPAVADRVFIQGDYYTTPQQRYYWIEGAKANLYVNLETREMYWRPKDQNPKLFFQAKDTWDDTYIEEMKAFINSINLGTHQAPLATGEDGVRALYTVMAAREAAGI